MSSEGTVKETSNAFKKLWDAWKGKILVAIISLVLGTAAVSSLTGLELVENDECDICLIEVEEAVNE